MNKGKCNSDHKCFPWQGLSLCALKGKLILSLLGTKMAYYTLVFSQPSESTNYRHPNQ
jgi:hypothetical protein